MMSERSSNILTTTKPRTSVVCQIDLQQVVDLLQSHVQSQGRVAADVLLVVVLGVAGGGQINLGLTWQGFVGFTDF